MQEISPAVQRKKKKKKKKKAFSVDRTPPFVLSDEKAFITVGRNGVILMRLRAGTALQPEWKQHINLQFLNNSNILWPFSEGRGHFTLSNVCLVVKSSYCYLTAPQLCF